jgi:tetratricopeptide (TPR) repeat protein
MLRFRRTGAASAYVHFLLAMEYGDRSDLAGVLRAQKALRRSVQLAPDYVPALNQLARTMTLEWLERAVPERDLLHEAMHLAERAHHYDPTDSGSLREIGHAALYLHDLDRALESYEAAEREAPNHADLLADQADVLTHASRADEAETRIARALALNPLAPDDYYWTAGAVSFFRGRYAEGLERLTAMKVPGLALRLMAACAAMNNDHRAAEQYRRRALERDPTFRIEKWTSLYPQPRKSDTDHFLRALKLAGFE